MIERFRKLFWKEEGKNRYPTFPFRKFLELIYRKNPLSRIFLKTNGGETGIRTLGTLRHDSFQDCCIKPLCHLSNMMTVVSIGERTYLSKFFAKIASRIWALLSWSWNLSISSDMMTQSGFQSFLYRLRAFLMRKNQRKSFTARIKMVPHFLENRESLFFSSIRNIWYLPI